MRAEIKKLHQKVRTTVVYVTHDQVEAMTLADRIVVMKDGTHRTGGHTHRGLHPARQYLCRGLHRLAAMNLMPGRIEEGDVVAVRPAHPPARPLAGRSQGRHEVTLGLRPDDINPLNPGQGGGEGDGVIISPDRRHCRTAGHGKPDLHDHGGARGAGQNFTALGWSSPGSGWISGWPLTGRICSTAPRRPGWRGSDGHHHPCRIADGHAAAAGQAGGCDPVLCRAGNPDPDPDRCRWRDRDGLFLHIGTGVPAIISLLRDSLIPRPDRAGCRPDRRHLARPHFRHPSTAVGAITSLALATVDTAPLGPALPAGGVPLWTMAGGAQASVPSIRRKALAASGDIGAVEDALAVKAQGFSGPRSRSGGRIWPRTRSACPPSGGGGGRCLPPVQPMPIRPSPCRRR